MLMIGFGYLIIKFILTLLFLVDILQSFLVNVYEKEPNCPTDSHDVAFNTVGFKTWISSIYIMSRWAGPKYIFFYIFDTWKHQ